MVNLTGGDCEFDKRTVLTAFAPIPSVAGAADNQAFNEAPIGNGPFMIKPGTKWEHNQRISLVRNDTYFGTKANLDGVEFLIFPAQGRLEAEYRAFTAGEADFARVPPSLFTQAKNTYEPQGSFFKRERFGINYILTNDATGPMANPDARKAVSLAIDREAINEGVFQGSLTPATAFLPPPFGDFHQDGVCGDCKFDVAKAKDLAAKGGLTPGTHLRLLYNNDGGHEALVQAWKDQLERNLGVVVDLDGVPFAESLLKRDAGEFDIARAGWGADYPTVENFLFPVLGSQSEDNDGRYNNPQVDALILKLRAEKNDDERAKAAQEAEKIAIGQDLAVIPTFYRTQYRVFDSKQVDRRRARLLREPHRGHHQPQGLTPDPAADPLGAHGQVRRPASPADAAGPVRGQPDPLRLPLHRSRRPDPDPAGGGAAARRRPPASCWRSATASTSRCRTSTSSYVGRLVHGDMGESFTFRRPVNDILGEKLGNTLKLGLAAIVVQIVLGLIAGDRGRRLPVLVPRRPGDAVDHASPSGSRPS